MSARDFQSIVEDLGLSRRIIEFDQSTRSAKEAAEAIGVELSQIVKSLVFRTEASNQAVMVLCSGSNRVDENKLAKYLGEQVRKADADFVHDQTGFSVGGVPPFGHLSTIRVFIDRDLIHYQELWAAAGTPNSVFPLTPGELETLSKGIWLCLKMDQA